MAYNQKTLKVWQLPSLISSLSHGLTFAMDNEVNERIFKRYRNYNYLTPSADANTAMLESVIADYADYTNRLYATTQYEYEPLLNYDMHESGAIIDELHKGTKTSTNTDVTSGTETDRKEARETSEKTATNTDMSETVKPLSSETTSVTGYGINSTSTGTDIQKTVKSGSGTDTVETKGDHSKNYVEVSGDEESNYLHVTGDEGSNYTHTAAEASSNYIITEDIDATHYDKNVHTFDEYRRYGNLGTTKTQDMIMAERQVQDLRVLDLYVSKFATCFDISSFIAYEDFEEGD